MMTHRQSVHEQFDPQAKAYLTSAVHAQGNDLVRAQALVKQAIPRTGVGLDIGCGAGHLSFALSPLVSRIVALDPSESMLATVREAAGQKELANIETKQGNAEELPFPDASFCLVATRYSAHHWVGLDRALAEMRRVLRPDGYILVIDVETFSDPLVDSHLQALELLHDRSHVRDRSEAEWRRHFQEAGFALLEHSRWPVRLEFASWVATIRTPPSKVAMIREIQIEAPREVREALAIEEDGSFTIQTGLLWGCLDS
ncbi:MULTISPECIES: class I SAM-dependent methyltransferase [Methylomicrobium]|uniref:Methylase involved in ubiquinone/menaquinone biosynthesis n=1 Tax=Methylomicrobium album BG8 TaxID=686340 RepID=H8GJE7_METAL|nr:MULTISPECIES: methyltransferase domain-containing protein [Methylomicrobium]EIC29137.1 methylase involved in ubiquinone/menaquinone biosynthesis [Methylomicrobium album BG8]